MSRTHSYTALCVIVVTVVVILAQLRPIEKKKPFLEPDAWLAMLLIFCSLTGLDFARES